jgi:hypothetical protein
MMRRRVSDFRMFLVICSVLSLFANLGCAFGQPASAAVSGFDSYIGAVESRLARQHQSYGSFLTPLEPSQSEPRLRRGEFIIEQLMPSAGTAALPGALLHHWLGSAFIPEANAGDFVRLMKNFNAYPQFFSPQVLKASVLAQHGDQFQVLIRVRERHVVTVVLDTTYGVTFGQLDAQHGYSISRSTQISEIDSAGNPNEHVLNSGESHGFLWRLNTYWTYEERDDGLYIQIESVSLTRSIPYGFGWAVRPYVESVPRESLEFTLRSTCNALRKQITEKDEHEISHNQR